MGYRVNFTLQLSRISALVSSIAVLSIAVLTLAAPTMSLAQTAPPSWATKDGRWNDWKDGTFATSAEQYAALKAAAKNGVHHTKLSIPDWSGLWTNAGFEPGAPSNWGAPHYKNAPGTPISFAPLFPGAPAVDPSKPQPERPIMTPFAQKKLEQELIRVSKGQEWDYLSYCLPAGFPRWYTEPFLREFIAAPRETWMINEQQSEVRRIYTDGRGHVPREDGYPLWEGDSIGFWDGDTLVIHTISTKPGTWNRSEPAYSDKTETVELVKKNAQGQIETRMTVYDPITLQKPWHVIWGSNMVDLKSAPDLRINMWSCSENNNVVKSDSGGSKILLPGEAGYKDPSKLTEAPSQ